MSGNDNASRRRIDLLCVAAPALVVLLIFLDAIVAGNAAVIGSSRHDIFVQYYPWRHFGFGVLSQGKVPLWNPYIYAGTPYVAGLQSAIFYPPNWLFLLMPTALGINWTIILHTLLAGLCAYALARYLGAGPIPGLAAGIVYMLGHPYFYHILAGHLSNLCTMAWTPAVLLASERIVRRRRPVDALLLSGLVVMQILAGHAQYVLFAMVAVALFLIVRCITLGRKEKDLRAPMRVIGLAVAAYGTAILLCGAQLVPAFEMASESMRQSVAGKHWAGLFSLAPENVPGFLLPDWQGDDYDFPYWGRNLIWEMSPYVGILPLLLSGIAIARRRNRYATAFAVIGMAGFLLALGKYGPVFHLLYYVPGYAQFRGNAKFLSLVLLAVSMLSAFGLHSLITEGTEARRRLLRRSLIALGALLLVLLFAWIWAAGRDGSDTNIWATLVARLRSLDEHYLLVGWPRVDARMFTDTFVMFTASLKRAMVFTAVSGAVLLPGLFLRIKAWWPAAIVAVIALNLWYYDHRHYGEEQTSVVMTPTRECHWSPELVQKIHSLPGPFRVWRQSDPTGREMDGYMTQRVAAAEGYDSNVVRHYGEYLNFTFGLDTGAPRLLTRFTGSGTIPQLANMSPHRELLLLLNLRYKIMDGRLRDGFPSAPLWEDDREALIRDEDALPRAIFVSEADLRAAQHKLLTGLHPVQRSVVARTLSLTQVAPPDLAVTPQFQSYSEHEMRIDLAADTPGWLAISDTWYPGWRAYVGRREQPIVRVNHAFRGIALSRSGVHQVECIYDPASFKLGLAVSLGSLAVIAAGLAGRLVGRRQSGS